MPLWEMLLAFLMRHTNNANLLLGSTLQVEASNPLHLPNPVQNPGGQAECPEAAKPFAAKI